MNTLEQLERFQTRNQKHLVNQQIHNANKRTCKVCHNNIFFFYVYCNMCGVKI